MDAGIHVVLFATSRSTVRSSQLLTMHRALVHTPITYAFSSITVISGVLESDRPDRVAAGGPKPKSYFANARNRSHLLSKRNPIKLDKPFETSKSYLDYLDFLPDGVFAFHSGRLLWSSRVCVRWATTESTSLPLLHVLVS